jgi:transaldolase / glucose-6-phosphate isomerase
LLLGKGALVVSAIEMKARIGPYAFAVGETLELMQSERAVERLWSHDYTLWRSDPTEITNRLGWLHSPDDMLREVGRLNAFARDVRSEGFSQVLLLGMGGSSLAPELFGKTLPGQA